MAVTVNTIHLPNRLNTQDRGLDAHYRRYWKYL